MAMRKTQRKPVNSVTGSSPVRKARAVPQHPRDRAATRERLIEAAIEIIRKRGSDALSTVSVTRAAGIVQSGFYAHFDDVDDCKQAAAEHVAARIRRVVAEHRRAGQQKTADLPSVTDHFEMILSLYQEERWFSELFLRYRYDRSPIGLVFRQLMDQMRTDLAADLRAQFEPLLPPGHNPLLFAAHAELLQGMVIHAGEAMNEGRVADRCLLARELARAAIGLATVLTDIP